MLGSLTAEPSREKHWLQILWTQKESIKCMYNNDDVIMWYMFHILIENTKAEIAQVQCSFSDIAHMVHSDGKKHSVWDSHMMFFIAKNRDFPRLSLQHHLLFKGDRWKKKQNLYGKVGQLGIGKEWRVRSIKNLWEGYKPVVVSWFNLATCYFLSFMHCC